MMMITGQMLFVTYNQETQREHSVLSTINWGLTALLHKRGDRALKIALYKYWNTVLNVYLLV